MVRINQRFLLAYHRHRENWEIPGGHIERGETPRQAAVRELREETGQTVAALRFEGVMQFRLHPDRRLEFGALFSGALPELQTFEANSEISRITLWDTLETIGPIDPIDQALIRWLIAGHPPAIAGLAGTPLPLDDGSRILDYIPAPPPSQVEGIKFTQIVARQKDRYLLVYDTHRAHWEFPAGGIEKGESWLDCALRETFEESGQTLRAARLAFLVRGYFPQRRVTAKAAIVTGFLTELRPFQATPEIAAIRLWDPRCEQNCLDHYNRSVLELVLGPVVVPECRDQ
jgi:8-oxo-dGTP diphosphatase